MAKVIAIGNPVNEDERRAIAHLRHHLPDSFTILHNFELSYDRQVYEIDLAVLAPHALYVVDIKGTRGHIEVAGGRWYPEGRQPFPSPIAKLRQHAKSLKTFLIQRHPGRREMEDIYVDAVMILTGQGVQLTDRSNLEKPATQVLVKSQELFTSTARLPPGKARSIAALHGQILSAIQGSATATRRDIIIGEWKVVERLGGNDRYDEYRGVPSLIPNYRVGVRIRSYKTDPYLPEAEREKQKLLVSTAYRSLISLPAHQNIVGSKTFLASETEDRFHLVTEEVVGQALRLHIDKPQLALTLAQKRIIGTGILQALSHIQANGVVHRNLTPSNILVGPDTQPRLTGFDFSRPGGTSTQTIADQIEDDLERDYLAPELVGNAHDASFSSDVFSAGILLHELFVGKRPFKDLNDLYEKTARFPQIPSQVRTELPVALDAWLQALCAFDPTDRPSAQDALNTWLPIWEVSPAPRQLPKPIPSALDRQQFYKNLQPGHSLTQKFVIEERLGQGAYGTVYRVTDTLGDISRVIKIIYNERGSTVEKVKKEYKNLLQLSHQNVVQVIGADWLSDGTPYLVFEFVEGRDLRFMIDQERVGVEDLAQIARGALEGLDYLHQKSLWHCDIKPSNILWTNTGAKLIDFNVSVRSTDDTLRGGGTRRYVPPDFDPSMTPTPDSLVDRDLFALAITLFEVASKGVYPWGDALYPTPQAPTIHLTDLTGCEDLSPDLLAILRKGLSPIRSDRFASARDFLDAFQKIKQVRKPRQQTVEHLAVTIPNTNPFVEFLSTCYSQSQTTNAGTRGKDRKDSQTPDLWVETDLERRLLPAIFNEPFQLVVISGNAGDGKTTFLQRIEERTLDEGGRILERSQNGAKFSLQGRNFCSNYDGSQDEGDQSNDQVLEDFFAPFKGKYSQWNCPTTHLIAINEGRLVDFLEEHRNQFPDLYQQVHKGLNGGPTSQGLAVVNLNLRSVVADPKCQDDSLFDRLLERMLHENFWDACSQCDLSSKCYAYQNVKTFQDPQAGKKVRERLRHLHTLVHLRNRLHVTVRDLRSALAFTLTSGRTCGQIHSLYQSEGLRREVLESWYYNSWKGGAQPTGDRLIAELTGLDMAHADDPRLDRGLDFGPPEERSWMFSFPERGKYDATLLAKEYSLLEALPLDEVSQRILSHRRYVGWLRRKAYFERRDDAWSKMVAYHHSQEFLDILTSAAPVDSVLKRRILSSMLHGEGISRPEVLPDQLALEVRRVEGSSLRSYRVFPGEQFVVSRVETNADGFVERLPTHLLLIHDNGVRKESLQINLDIFEILSRREGGYRASQEEEQGFALRLEIFKNLLLSSPSQELWLTKDGRSFYSMRRTRDGHLHLSSVEGQQHVITEG